MSDKDTKSLDELWDDKSSDSSLFGPLPYDMELVYGEDSPIALIDGDSLLYYEMNKPTLEEAMKSLDDRIISILAFCETCNFVGFLTIGKCFRYDVAKQRPYKGNRKGGPKPPIFYALREYIQQTWKFRYVKGLEADDLVCAYKTGNSILCSPDKDVLLQTQGRHFNYGKSQFVKTTHKDAARCLWIQMLMGDPGDGIPGIPKIGPKTAELIVKDQEITDLPQIVLNKYIEKFGILKGITIFEETFNLIYILRSADDVLHRTGIQLEKLDPININVLNNSINGNS